ncbi:hypothetical protein C0991_011695 [Blastosporella zonata]|nr:hypothetical protein C0991_011695 [Blastosporella zonata]
MSAATITISYELNPPEQTVQNAEGLKTSKTLTHAVGPSPEGVDLETYYGALREAIAGAKDQLGNELTAWRDAVGKAELSKETPKTLNYDADEEQEEEE